MCSAPMLAFNLPNSLRSQVLLCLILQMRTEKLQWLSKVLQLVSGCSRMKDCFNSSPPLPVVIYKFKPLHVTFSASQGVCGVYDLDPLTLSWTCVLLWALESWWMETSKSCYVFTWFGLVPWVLAFFPVYSLIWAFAHPKIIPRGT